MRKLKIRSLFLALVLLIITSLYSSYAEGGRKAIVDYSSISALINHENYLPSNYEPDDLVIPRVPRQTYNDTTAKMRKEAAEALEALYAGVQAEGLSFYNVSGYRPYSMQQEIFDEEVARSGYEIAALYIALPGSSEHQSGLAMDVSSAEMGGGLYASFGDTQEGIWLANNCHKYGFIIRYPKDKEHITKIAYEPWHLRYVGISLATKLKRENLALEEYYTLPAKYNLAKVRVLDGTIEKAAYNIEGYNYFRLRDIAELLIDTSNRFNVVWNEKEGAAEIVRGVNYSSEFNSAPKTDGLNRAIKSNQLKIKIDGEYKTLYGYLIDGYNYYKLRDLQNLLNYRVEWIEKERLIDLLLPSLQ